MGLVLQHVTKQFGSFVAVDDVTLSIPKQRMFGFLGANGAGKTTTFRMILGLLEPTKGEITWDGERITYKCQGRLFFPQNRRFKIPQKDLIDPSVFLVGAFFPAIDSFPPLG